jgi:hypothetical protein
MISFNSSELPESFGNLDENQAARMVQTIGVALNKTLPDDCWHVLLVMDTNGGRSHCTTDYGLDNGRACVCSHDPPL